MGEGVELIIFRYWLVSEDIDEPAEEQRLPGLPGIQALC